MKSISKTFLYKMLNKSNDLNGELTKINSPLNIVDLEDLNGSLDVINRKFNYLMKNKIIDDVNKGLVIPVLNESTINLPTFIPVVGIKENSVPVSYVNLTGQAKINQDGSIEIDPRKLFAYLQTGTILRNISTLNWKSVDSNMTLLKDGSLAYSKLFTKVLDKMLAVNLIPLKSDIVRYLTAKFFLVNIMGKEDGDLVKNIAYQSVYNKTTKATLFDIDINFTEDAYDDIEKFINNLSSLEGMSSLSIRSFLENWMKMYDSSTVLALEYYPFFLHMIFSAMVNAHINNEFIIEPLVSKEISSLYRELGRIIR